AHGDGADVAVNGNIDLGKLAVDAQLTMTGPASGAGLRPDIFLLLSGSVPAATRTVDVSAFANWLLLRSLDRAVGKAEAAAAEREATTASASTEGSRSTTNPPLSDPAGEASGTPQAPVGSTTSNGATSTTGRPAPALPPPTEIGRTPGGEHPRGNSRRTAGPV